MRKTLVMTVLIISILGALSLFFAQEDSLLSSQDSTLNSQPSTLLTPHYKEVSYPTPNFDPEARNTVEGVILHHTAEPTIESSLRVLTVGERHVGTHVVIDTDGTRYIMCAPEVVTYHAGSSILNGKEGCNYFTVGIEFQPKSVIRE